MGNREPPILTGRQGGDDDFPQIIAVANEAAPVVERQRGSSVQDQLAGLPTNVQVGRTGNTVTIQPEDSAATFRMDLQMSGAVVSGTASGEYRSGDTPVTVTGLKSDIADAIGTVAGSGAAGNLTGSIAIPGVSCNGGNWSLTTR